MIFPKNTINKRSDVLSKFYKVAVVGGGAAGLLCAARLVCGDSPLCGKDVLLLEKCDRVGKKLIATGNGRGNLFNAKFGAEFYHGEKNFINSFVKNFISENPPDFLEKLGIPLAEEDGKIYPASFQASAVLDVLRSFLEYKGVRTETSAEVTGVSRADGGFRLQTIAEEYFAQKLVLAFGGAAAKQFGTDGKSFALAKMLGHTVTKLCPSLVQLKTKLTHIKGLKGLKENVGIEAVSEGKSLGKAEGELLFTEYGVSGNAIFKISSLVTDKDNVTLKIEFAPQFSTEKIYELLEYRSNLRYINYNDLLTGIVNKRIGAVIIKRAGAEELFNKESTRSVALKKITETLKCFKLKETGNLGFDYAQVTKGGVNTDEIDPKTYESKKTKGAYIVGEALDADGDCGGYNLSFAFATGMTAADDIINRLKIHKIEGK